MQKSENVHIRLGTSSFASTDWVGPFYPDGTRPANFLKFYCSQFETVEIDASYYRIPTPAMIASWKDHTPDDFIISAKFPRSIVHAGKTSAPDSGAVLSPARTYRERDRFLEVIAPLGKRLGTLVLQFPYFSKKHFARAGQFFDRLQGFLKDLPAEFSYGVEIRNRNWLTAEFAELLRNYRVALVLTDQAWMPHGDEIEKSFDPLTSDHVYVRLLGDRQVIEALTTTWDREVIDRRERLERWADFLAGLYRRQVNSLVYVNNHYAGHAPATVRSLAALIRHRLQ